MIRCDCKDTPAKTSVNPETGYGRHVAPPDTLDAMLQRGKAEGISD